MNMEFKLSDLINVIAIVAGPILAILVSFWRENRARIRHKKEHIFVVLMANRRQRVQQGVVEMLNIIDVAYCTDSADDKSVREAWHYLRDHYNDIELARSNIVEFNRIADDRYSKMLHTMSVALGYHVSLSVIQGGGYTPEAFGNIQSDQEAINKGWIKVLSGENALRVKVDS